MWIELIGILASVLTLISFLFTNAIKIRIINLGGAISFMTYGIFLHSPSLIVCNIILIIIHVYHLIKLFKHKNFS